MAFTFDFFILLHLLNQELQKMVKIGIRSYSGQWKHDFLHCAILFFNTVVCPFVVYVCTSLQFQRRIRSNPATCINCLFEKRFVNLTMPLLGFDCI